MNATAMGLAIIMAAGMAGTIGYIVNNVIGVYKDIKAEESQEKMSLYDKRNNTSHVIKEVWFNVGDAIEYRDTKGIIIGAGLNDTITILLDDNTIVDVSAGRIRKVVFL